MISFLVLSVDYEFGRSRANEFAIGPGYFTGSPDPEHFSWDTNMCRPDQVPGMLPAQRYSAWCPFCVSERIAPWYNYTYIRSASTVGLDLRLY